MTRKFPLRISRGRVTAAGNICILTSLIFPISDRGSVPTVTLCHGFQAGNHLVTLDDEVLSRQ